MKPLQFDGTDNISPEREAFDNALCKLMESMGYDYEMMDYSYIDEAINDMIDMYERTVGVSK